MQVIWGGLFLAVLWHFRSTCLAQCFIYLFIFAELAFGDWGEVQDCRVLHHFEAGQRCHLGFGRDSLEAEDSQGVSAFPLINLINVLPWSLLTSLCMKMYTMPRFQQINMMLANLYRKAGQERSAVTSYKEVLRQCPLALDAIIGTWLWISFTYTGGVTDWNRESLALMCDEIEVLNVSGRWVWVLGCFAGLLSLSVKGAEVASMTMDVIQSIPNLDWLSVWIKAYAFIHGGDNHRAINTIWWGAHFI